MLRYPSLLMAGRGRRIGAGIGRIATRHAGRFVRVRDGGSRGLSDDAAVQARRDRDAEQGLALLVRNEEIAGAPP